MADGVKKLAAKLRAGEKPGTQIGGFDVGRDSIDGMSYLYFDKTDGRAFSVPRPATVPRIDDDLYRRIMQMPASTVTTVERPLSDYPNAELIMEMLSRGFAVLKVPEGKDRPAALDG